MPPLSVLTSWRSPLIPVLLSTLTLTVQANTDPKQDEKEDTEQIERLNVVGTYTRAAMNSATGLSMSLKETPQSVTLITEEMISDKGLITMESVLNHTPGVTMVGDASENSKIFVRGYALDSGVQIDGLITTSSSNVYSGSIDQGLDPVIAERVEVLKGAAGILSGLGEPSATVNFIRKRPTDDTRATASVSYGSWNTYRLEADVSGWLTDSGNVKGRFVSAVKKGDSFIDRYQRDTTVLYGVVETSLGTDTSLSLFADYQKSQTDGVYNWNSNPAFYTDGTAVDFGRSYSSSQDWTHWDVTQKSLMAEFKHRFDNDWSLVSAYRIANATIDALAFYPGDNIVKSTGEFVGPWGDTYAAQHDRESDTNSFNLYATGNFDLLGREHSAVIGFNYGDNEFDNINTNSAPQRRYNVADQGNYPKPNLPNSPTNGQKNEQSQSGVYGTVRINVLDSLKLMVGGRVSNWSYEKHDLVGNSTDATMEKTGIFIPYYGLVYDVTEQISVYASRTEIFKPGTYFGEDGQLLEPAEGTNVEGGIKVALFDDTLNMSAAVYETNKDNEPEYAGKGQLPSGDFIYESVDGITTKGYELEIAGRLTDLWDISGGYTHNDAEDEDGLRRQTYLPEDIFKLTTKYNFEDILPGVTAGASWRWQSSTFYQGTIWGVDGAPNVAYRQAQSAYSLVDLMFGYQITPSISMQVNINNIFDKNYNRSLWGYADFGEPRNATLSLRWTL